MAWQNYSPKGQQQSKYRNKKTLIDGIKFDSKFESERYQELKLMEAAGVIKGLELQKKFKLIDTIRLKNKTLSSISYKADFYYIENGKEVVEDTKGMETDVFRLKYRLFLLKYPEIDFRIIKR